MGTLVSSKTSEPFARFPSLLSQNEIDRQNRRFKNFLGLKILGRSRPHDRCQDELPHKVEPPSSRPQTSEEIKATTMSVRNLHEHGDLYLRYLRARRDIFIIQKQWRLPEIDGMEFDQYDTPLARWIALERGSEILGGARISPTTALCGQNSYMLRDAQLGMLPGLPTDMLFDTAPVRPDIWEATRLFVTDSARSEERLRVQTRLMLELAAAARSVSATHLIGIVPAVFPRWLKRIGMSAKAVGPVKTIDGDKVQAALMNVLD